MVGEVRRDPGCDVVLVNDLEHQATPDGVVGPVHGQPDAEAVDAGALDPRRAMGRNWRPAATRERRGGDGQRRGCRRRSMVVRGVRRRGRRRGSRGTASGEGGVALSGHGGSGE